MKKLLLLAALALLLVGCAKTNKEFKFVPLQISWHAAEGVDTDSKSVSTCMVKVTNALMQSEVVQKYADANVSYDADIAVKADAFAFKGECPADAFVSDEVCSWTADCDAQGEIVNLKIGK